MKLEIIRETLKNKSLKKEFALITNLINGDEIKQNLKIDDGPILGELLEYLSRELAYKRLNNFDEAIFKAKQWIEQNAPKCD